MGNTDRAPASSEAVELRTADDALTRHAAVLKCAAVKRHLRGDVSGLGNRAGRRMAVREPCETYDLRDPWRWPLQGRGWVGVGGDRIVHDKIRSLRSGTRRCSGLRVFKHHNVHALNDGTAIAGSLAKGRGPRAGR